MGDLFHSDALTCPFHPDTELAITDDGFQCPCCDYRTYWYVNRWYDEHGTAHYFGIQTKWPTLREARQNVRFNVIAVPVDLVYGPCTVNDLETYSNDMSNESPDDQLPDLGTFSWLD